ncbi:S1C family serine protease [Candidatus Nitrospira allomarina]|uniref:Trypsin-like peptidase domain-containing protein n=1 Tax=Candidatus Nitrospira allomarina TaxID=3020900 RepID=A0AA96G8E9_9BACT|nr:trypsin-like peptidase domain-containing protein [Candidatus Nitrospira allomarina]WNM57309.1 trypsin-like peptidase domain-containing protein [Candidatus Nitrospira allomarina]
MLLHHTPQTFPSDRAKVRVRPHRRFGKWQKPFLLVAFVTGFLPNIAIGEPFVPKQARSISTSPSYLHLVAQKPLGAEELNTIAVFEKAAQSVVYITNTAVRRDIWSLNTFEVPQGSGSGFIWNRQGHIVTNYHVIYGADSIQVVLDDQSTTDARIVGVDPDHDLAVLQITGKAESLMPLEIGTSQDLRVGQRVLAIGNPFGLDHTLTTGVVSALGRSIKSVNDRTIENAIQTDAAINPGNSGGPLLNSAGELIGVNTQIVSPSGAYAGIGFAVPVDIVKRVVPQLIQYGKVIRPGLGISLIPDSIAARWGIKGLVIAKVLPGSMADKAGLQGLEETKTGRIRLGDVITNINGEAIRTYDDLARLLDRHNVGDRIKLGIRRSGKEQTLSLTLQAVQ